MQGRKHLGAAWCFFNLLFASMLLIVVARNGLLFIMAWEGMSLSSFFLVMFEHEKPGGARSRLDLPDRRPPGGGLSAGAVRAAGGAGGEPGFRSFDRPVRSGSRPACCLCWPSWGFGAKAGFLPLHVWLPEAHPAAPSHVSAVMSGVMIKTGIYGLVRIVPLLGPPPAVVGLDPARHRRGLGHPGGALRPGPA